VGCGAKNLMSAFAGAHTFFQIIHMITKRTKIKCINKPGLFDLLAIPFRSMLLPSSLQYVPSLFVLSFLHTTH